MMNRILVVLLFFGCYLLTPSLFAQGTCMDCWAGNCYYCEKKPWVDPWGPTLNPGPGDGGGSTSCTVTVYCYDGWAGGGDKLLATYSCTSNQGRCTAGRTWIKCDGKTYQC